MKCIKCHAEIEQDAQFCPYCGTKVEHIRCCVNCGKPLDDDSDFCPYCGTKQNDVVVEPEQVGEVHSQEPELVQEKPVPTPVVVEQPQEPEIVQEEPEPIPVIVEQPQEPEEKKVESEPPSSSVQEEIVDTEQAYESSQSSKKWLWIIGAILLLGILGGGGYYFMNSKGDSPSFVETDYVETDSIVEVGDSIVTDIHSIDGIKTRVKDILSKAFKMQDKDAISSYFSKEYQVLYNKTIELDNIGYGEAGFWNGSIWDGSQDGDPDAFEIVRVSTSSSSLALADVNVSHNMDDYHSENRVNMVLVFENGNWFIDNIDNLKQQMQEWVKGAHSEFALSDLIYIQEMGDVSYANNMLKLKGYSLKGDNWVKGNMTISFNGKVLRVEATSDDEEDPFPKGWDKEFKELEEQGYESIDSSVGMVSRTDYNKQGQPIISIGSAMGHYVLSIGEQAGL